MKWPKWTERAIRDQHCSACGQVFDLKAIVGVGARYLERRGGLRAGPTAFLLLRCLACFSTATVENIVIPTLVHDAIVALYGGTTLEGEDAALVEGGGENDDASDH